MKKRMEENKLPRIGFVRKEGEKNLDEYKRIKFGETRRSEVIGKTGGGRNTVKRYT